jgi:DNA-binding XRE family transcriptional regulator
MVKKYHKNTPAKPIGSKDKRVRMLFKHVDRSGVSLAELSERCGVDRNTLSMWRTGKSSPRLDLFIAVCDAVGLECQLELKL